ncbi:hypothetical protein MUN82_09195 [Hymenobacter aerilatus]|uniref:Uncharacterized protein n=1 Tax=Hymenobacter aerilatus TaxID=2932251 RepID=A0A8T9SYV1_9BACT|nr:hypothetical protein [Hymenobacter aerilatus]UOR07258.1 hypothetical protein MUN82_09195 [Hymenobacter aerilatus]
MTASTSSLAQQRTQFASRRLLAMPLAGTLAWAVVGVAGLTLSSPLQLVWTLYLSTGSIVYLGMFFSRFTGEHFLDRTKPKNEFDTLFFSTVAMSLLVYALAIPFALTDYTSLPLTVGVLTGLMWLPLSWIIRHWVGVFHAVARTVLVLAAWYAFPAQRFVIIPFLIVGLYVATILILEYRWRAVRQQSADSELA